MNVIKKKPTYGEAINEIEEILEQIETGDLDVDELSEKVKRVSALVTVCREKLHNTELEIEKVLNEMEDKR